ncbi:MAG TPA: sulfatase-like hydrolase/transferase, partial [Thermoplasmata archaeon]|nr:sulfatase-like hydrolase/transferase [Thermoplasmata archaeon]
MMKMPRSPRRALNGGTRATWRLAVAIVLVAGLLAAALVPRWRNRRGARGRPRLNVLLVTVDTLRADALGAYGNRDALTPWIDRLAASGVRFDDAHAHNVVTLPSHANILSGRYPFDHGVRDNQGFRFPKTVDTLATLLHARGYR